MFRLKDNLYTLLLIGANGNIATFIGGATFYSAVNIRFKSKNKIIKTISKEEKFR